MILDDRFKNSDNNGVFNKHVKSEYERRIISWAGTYPVHYFKVNIYIYFINK